MHALGNKNWDRPLGSSRWGIFKFKSAKKAMHGTYWTNTESVNLKFTQIYIKTKSCRGAQETSWKSKVQWRGP